MKEFCEPFNLHQSQEPFRLQASPSGNYRLDFGAGQRVYSMKYRIKNWSAHQHYKDRCPPWIKLHHAMLTSEMWVMGTDATRALAVACMLLAARNESLNGEFNGDPEYVKRFAYLNSKPDFNQLIQYDFIELVQDASVALAECNTEKRREEEEKSIKTTSASDDAGVEYSKAFIAFWEMYPLKKNKGLAFKSFKKIKPVEYPAIKAGLITAQKSEAWLKDNGQFIPHPSSWLNARGWEDEARTDQEGKPFDMSEWMRDNL